MKRFRHEFPPQVIEEDARVLRELKKTYKTFTNIGIRLGIPRASARATVSNWVRRGIPYKYKALYPELFMPHIMGSRQAEQSSPKENP